MADPLQRMSSMARMTFEQRRAQLQAWLRSGNTDAVFAAYQGSPFNGSCPPAGMLFSQMIERVLEREFPEQHARARS
jgi:hypothetical protein